MRTWLAALLFLLLAVPYHPDWQNYESARRGLLLILAPVFCLWPGVLPNRMARAIVPFLLLAGWLVIRSIGVTNAGLGLERTMLWLALVGLMLAGQGFELRQVCRAMLPAGLVVALVALLHRNESTLGNSNVASEWLTMAGAACAALPCCGDKHRLLVGGALATLFLCGMAVVANTSLSGLIALPLAALPGLLAVGIPGRTRFGVVAVLAAGMLAGTGVRPAPDPAAGTGALDTATPAPAPAPAPSTTEVRLQVWTGTLRMAAAAPVLGQGTGQFPVEYPRFRTAGEIELTSFSRSFSTAVESAHNDYLELLAEAGLPGLALLALGLVMVLRQAPLPLWGPLLAFGFLAGVRAPLGNAPSAAFLFLFLGALLRDARPQVSLDFKARRVVVALLALAVLWTGVSVFMGQWAFTGYLAQARGRTALSPAAIAATDAALFWNAHDQKFLQARADRGLKLLVRGNGTAADAERFVRELLDQHPHDEEGLLLRAQLRHLQGQRLAALAALHELLAQDPQNPRAILRKAEILVDSNDAATAIAVLYQDPHPRLRRELPRLLAQLMARAQQAGAQQAGSGSGSVRDADLLAREQAFLEAIDALRERPGIASHVPVKRFLDLDAKTPATGHERDMRRWVVSALQFLALDMKADAVEQAQPARACRLAAAHKQLFGSLLDRLRALPEWREVLADRPQG